MARSFTDASLKEKQGMTDRVTIRRLATGVPGLDQILGGGLPEYLVQSHRRGAWRWEDDARATDHVRARQPG
ncbi:MAG: hypothetical protein MZV49_09080 [Rhodopseudomonas palustris]|nr:hypothetical protein [Rhodopseudomonas palustris]